MRKERKNSKIHYHVPALLVLFAKTCFTWIALLTLPELLALSVDPTLIQEMLAHLKMNAWMTVGVVNQMQSCWSVASPASDIYSRLFYTLAYHVCTSCIWNVSICMLIYLNVWFRCISNACRFTIDFASRTDMKCTRFYNVMQCAPSTDLHVVYIEATDIYTAVYLLCQCEHTA